MFFLYSVAMLPTSKIKYKLLMYLIRLHYTVSQFMRFKVLHFKIYSYGNYNKNAILVPIQHYFILIDNLKK